MAGSKTPQLQTEAEMVKAIRETGRCPVQRNTFYEPVKVWDPPMGAAPGKDETMAEQPLSAV